MATDDCSIQLLPAGKFDGLLAERINSNLKVGRVHIVVAFATPLRLACQ